MKRILISVLALGALAGQLSAGEIRLSLGVRETNEPSGTPIGSDGGATGSIEWVGRPNDATQIDVALVPDDNAWHLVTFDLNTGPFRGFTGNHILETTTGLGVLEHLRIANTADGFTHYRIYIDDVTNTVNGTPTLITDFDSAIVGTEVMFQEPRFSGSTDASINLTPNISRVSTLQAFSGANSYEVEFEFINDTAAAVGGPDPGGWVRLTTGGAAPLRDPVIGIPGATTNTSTVSMQIRIEAIPEPAAIGLASLSALVLVALRRRAT
jgi:hypothetical protein